MSRKRLSPLLAGVLAFTSLATGAGEVEAAERYDIEMLADINTDNIGSFPWGFVQLGDKVIFAAEDVAHGWEIWTYDTSSQSMSILRDLTVGPDGGGPSDLIVHDGLVYFDGDDGVHGSELWATDGTPAGTKMIGDVIPDGELSPRDFVVANGDLYFSGTGPVGRELWRSDGTAAGTEMLSSVSTTPSNAARSITVVPVTPAEDVVFFTSLAADTGTEVYRYDEDDGVQLFDIEPGPETSQPGSLVALDDALYFVTTWPDGRKLWFIEGATSPTLKEVLLPNPIAEVVSDGSTLFLRTQDSVTGSSDLGLIKSPGDAPDIFQGGLSARSLGSFGSRALVLISEGDGYKPFVTDGTGFVQLSDVNVDTGLYPRTEFSPNASNSVAYYRALNGSGGYGMWRTDGTESGTFALTGPDVTEVDLPAFELSDGSVIMPASFGSDVNHEPTLSAGGREDAKTIGELNDATNSSSPSGFTEAGDHVVFVADDGVHSRELWSLHRPTGAVSMVKDLHPTESSRPNNLFSFGSNALFTAQLEGDTVPSLMITDGTDAGTKLLASEVGPNGFSVHYVIAGSRVFVDLHDSLWVTDGTAAGTTELLAGNIYAMSALGSQLVFRYLNEAESRSELWVSDGTVAGTKFLSELTGGSLGQLVEFDGFVYYLRGSSGSKSLFRTDGTVAGTVDLGVTAPASTLSLTADDARLYAISNEGEALTAWSAEDPVAGFVESPYNGPEIIGASAIQEISTVQGGRHITTFAGPDSNFVLVFDETSTTAFAIDGSVVGDKGTAIGVHDERFYFSTGVGGSDLWYTDGTASGTVEIDFAGSSVERTRGTIIGDHLYFEGRTNGAGYEPFSIQLSEALVDPDPDPDPDPSGSEVVSLTPGRVFASRSSDETVDGLFEGDGRLPGGDFVEVDIAGRAGVAVDAKSVVMNITAINPSGRGFITTYPCGDRPLASSLNYGAAGVVVGNELVAKLSGEGAVCVFTSAETDLSIDVVGYVPAVSEVVSVDPGRVYATRASDETVDGLQDATGRILAGEFVEVDLAGRAGVPSSGAGSVVMNITAINPSGRGYMTVFPCGDRPLASSLNYGAAGAVVGNELIAKLSADGSVCVFSSAETDLTVDVVGYIQESSAATSLDPARVYATRASDETVDGEQEATGQIPAGEFVEVEIAGRAGVPASAGAVVMNITAINPTGRGFITTYPCEDRPLASSLNYGAAGAVVGNELVAKLSTDGTVCVYSSAATDLTVDVVGYIPA